MLINASHVVYFFNNFHSILIDYCGFGINLKQLEKRTIVNFNNVGRAGAIPASPPLNGSGPAQLQVREPRLAPGREQR